MPCVMPPLTTSLIVTAALRIAAAASKAQTGCAPNYGRSMTATSCRIWQDGLRRSRPKSRYLHNKNADCEDECKISAIRVYVYRVPHNSLNFILEFQPVIHVRSLGI